MTLAFLVGVAVGTPVCLCGLPLLCIDRSRRIAGAISWVPAILLAMLAGAWQPGPVTPNVVSGQHIRVQGWIASRPSYRYSIGRALLRVESIRLVSSDSLL